MNPNAERLISLFKQCQKKSSEIVKLSIQILEEIKDTRSEIYIPLTKEYSFIPIKKIQYYMIASVDRLIHDVELFLKEKESVSILDDLEDNYPEYSESYPFVTGLWSGDIYDQTNIKGFEMFYFDLEKTFKILNDEKLFIDFLQKNYLDTY